MFHWTGSRLLVRDLDSRNGTWVNGVRLTSEREVASGDQVKMGNITVQIVTLHEWEEQTGGGTRLLREIASDTEELTTTVENGSMIDLAEVLLESCVQPEQRTETAHTLMGALDDLMDRAGYASPRLDEEEARRLRTIGDTVERWGASESFTDWRKQLERRILGAMRASRPPSR